ncbi:MAG: hypothetical protein AB7G44_13605 [Bacteroidia bacterium]
MEYHPFHFELARKLIRHKVKGHYWMELTVDDRIVIARELKFKVSESYCKRILNENGKTPETLDQKILDALTAYIGYKHWNDFMIKNPLNEKLYHHLKQPANKALLERYVNSRIKELLIVQLVIEFPE